MNTEFSNITDAFSYLFTTCLARMKV